MGVFIGNGDEPGENGGLLIGNGAPGQNGGRAGLLFGNRGKGGEPVGSRCTPMEFRVFGEVTAVVDGSRLELGHARQRCVLAALVVDVNRPVSVEQLIDWVWADRPPRRARNAVAGYLSRLRTLLAGGDVEIARGPVGYTLIADEDAVDLMRFRRLAAAARIASDPNEALTFVSAGSRRGMR